MFRYNLLLLFFFFICFSSCSSREYRKFYSHLKTAPVYKNDSMSDSPYYLVFLVDAHHLDYMNSDSLIKSLEKNPQLGRKGVNVGHAWICLRGFKEDREVFIEGGHTGEWGLVQPKYFDGVMNYIQYGYANPNKEKKQRPRKEKNPIKYLWVSLYDGSFQKGSGGHKPTFAAKVNLTKKEFDRVYDFIQSSNYYYLDYALLRNQCSSFLSQIASLINLNIKGEVSVQINKELNYRGKKFVLWEDSKYSEITFSTPDLIEKELMRLVEEKRAEYALLWYQKKMYKSQPYS